MPRPYGKVKKAPASSIEYIQEVRKRVQGDRCQCETLKTRLVRLPGDNSDATCGLSRGFGLSGNGSFWPFPDAPTTYRAGISDFAANTTPGKFQCMSGPGRFPRTPMHQACRVCAIANGRLVVETGTTVNPNMRVL